MIRGCCKKCKLLKEGVCKDNHEPEKGFNSSIYQCRFKKAYAKDKKKDDKKKVNILIELLDAVFGNYIRYRDRGECVTCPSKFDPAERTLIHAGHYISRRFKNTRFDEENVWGQCRNCNGKQNHEGNGMMLEELLKQKKLSIGQVSELRERSKKIRHFTAPELEDLIARYKVKLEKEKKKYASES